jgi:hypothetical protein
MSCSQSNNSVMQYLHDMFIVEPCSLSKTHEKLRSIRIGACISHAQSPRPCVFHFEVLVCKLGPVNRLASCSIAWFGGLCWRKKFDFLETSSPSSVILHSNLHTSSSVPALSHEARNYSMEQRAFEMKRFARFSNTFFSSA